MAPVNLPATNHLRQLIPGFPINRLSLFSLSPCFIHLPLPEGPQPPHPSRPLPKRSVIIRLHPPNVLISIHICLDLSPSQTTLFFSTSASQRSQKVPALVLPRSRYCNGIRASLRRLPRSMERKTLAPSPRLSPDLQA